MAWSIPVSSIASAVSGTVAGQIVGDECDKRGMDPITQGILTAGAHWAASSIAGYTVNTIGLDPVGHVWTTAQSPVTALGHGALRGAVKKTHSKLKDA